MALSKVVYVQSNIFEIRPIDEKYICYGISISDNEKMEKLLDWARRKTVLDISLYPNGDLSFEELSQ